MTGRLAAWSLRCFGSRLAGTAAIVALAVLAGVAPALGACRSVGVWHKFTVCDRSGSSGGSDLGPTQRPKPPPIPKPKDPAALHYESATEARRSGDRALAVERLERAYQALDKFRNQTLHRTILNDLSTLYVELANAAIRRSDYLVVRGYLQNAADWAWYLNANFQDRSWLSEAERLQRWLDGYERRQGDEARGRERLAILNQGKELLDGGRAADAVRYLEAKARAWPGDDGIRGLLLQAEFVLDAQRGAALAANRARQAERDAQTGDKVRRDLAELMATLANPEQAPKGSALSELLAEVPAAGALPSDASVVDLRDLGTPGQATVDPHRIKGVAPAGSVPVPVAALSGSLPRTTDDQAHRRNTVILDAIQEGQRRRGATKLDWPATLAYLREARSRYPDDLAVRDAAVMLLAVAAIGVDTPGDRRGLLPLVTAADLPDYETWSLLVRAEHHRYAGVSRFLGDRNGWSLVRRELETARELYNQAHQRNLRSLALRDLVNDTDGLVMYFIGLEHGP